MQRGQSTEDLFFNNILFYCKNYVGFKWHSLTEEPLVQDFMHIGKPLDLELTLFTHITMNFS